MGDACDDLHRLAIWTLRISMHDRAQHAMLVTSPMNVNNAFRLWIVQKLISASRPGIIG